MNHSSAKDFSKYPHLLDQHVERLKAAQAAADGYMRPSPLRTVGLFPVKQFISSPAVAAEISDEIENVRPGDGKRQDSLVTSTTKGSACRFCAEDLIWPVVRRQFTGHLDDVECQLRENTYLQHLYNSPDDNDEQKVFHSDTFFPAIKFWYFPQAVGIEDGPLMYVPNSPILTPQLLTWHAEQVRKIKAGDIEPWRGRGHREGSLRISEAEIAALGLKPEAVTVDADTLVIANVMGFHRRGDTVRPTHRLAIHGSIRLDNPF